MENLTQETFTKNDFLRKPQTFPACERKVIYGIANFMHCGVSEVYFYAQQHSL